MEHQVATGFIDRLKQRVFIALCIIPFFLLPILSLSAGISGDEPVHYEQAERVYQYFATHGRDTSAIHTPITFLKYYGQSIDNFSYLVNRTFGFQQPYTTRHIINALAGALTLLFTGLLAMELAGYGAGILAILFLILSPVFLGHSFNNLKDIPFALGYMVSIYYLFQFLRKFPTIHFGYLAGMIAGVGFDISVRIGGLVIIPIILTFSAIQAWVKRPAGMRQKQMYFLRLSGCLLVAMVLACVLGIAGWPYGLQHPIRNSIDSLNQMTHYLINIRQLFEGKIYWSQSLPWYYAPKYFLMVTPAIILLGVLFCRPLWKKCGSVNFLLLLFCAFFPLFWVIIRHSNLYGNIRHLLFIYPVMVLLSACGWSMLLHRSHHRYFRWGLTGVLVAGLAAPLIHIIKNHPVEYVYFNRISGGLAHAYGNYETDYYFHSLGPAVKWLDNEILSKTDADTLVIASNFPLAPFLSARHPKTAIVYTTWHERGQYNWDYGLFVNAYLSPSVLQNQIWRSAQTIHTIDVNGYPMCLVMHRVDKRDFQGYELFKRGQYDESARVLQEYLRKDSTNETAWLYLGWSLRKIRATDASDQAARQLLRIHPESEQGRELLIWNCLDTKRFSTALTWADQLYQLNPIYPPSLKLRAAARDSISMETLKTAPAY